MADAIEDRLAVIEDDFRAGRGCSDADGLALVAEVRRLRDRLREKNEIIRAFAGPDRMTPEDVAEARERLARADALVKETCGRPCANHWEMSPGRRPLPTDEEGESPTGEEGYALVEGDGDEDYLGWTPFLGCATTLVSRHNELVNAICAAAGEPAS